MIFYTYLIADYNTTGVKIQDKIERMGEEPKHE